MKPTKKMENKMIRSCNFSFTRLLITENPNFYVTVGISHKGRDI